MCLPVTYIHLYLLSNNTKGQFCSAQMMEKLEDVMTAMEHNIALRLDRIELRLDSLEAMVSWRSFMCWTNRSSRNTVPRERSDSYFLLLSLNAAKWQTTLSKRLSSRVKWHSIFHLKLANNSHCDFCGCIAVLKTCMILIRNLLGLTVATM